MDVPGALLEVRHLTKTFPGGTQPVHALRGVTLTVAREEVVALVGPSGSGKTTLLMTLLGWEDPEGGEVAWRGSSFPHLGHLDWGEVSVVGQRLGLLDELTVEENIELPLAIAGMSRGDRADRVALALTEFDLEPVGDRHPRATSLGEQQRTAIARAIVRTPRLLLADEPTSHQDSERKALVLRRLAEHTSLGGSCLVATHDPETLAFCDRILRIDSGVLEAPT